jgi:hypothetical protein
VAAIEYSLACTGCEADLKGVDSEANCPTCGSPASASIAAFVRYLGVDPLAGEIVADLDCSECGYNLRTLPCDSRCPECGTLVCKSLGLFDLRLSHPSWPRLLRRGVTLCAVALIIQLVCLLLFFVLHHAGFRPFKSKTDIIGVSVFLVGVVTVMLWIKGICQSTLLEPHIRLNATGTVIRFIARWGSLFSSPPVVLLLIALLIELGRPFGPVAGPRRESTPYLVALGTASVLTALTLTAFGLYLGLVAHRARRRQAVRVARISALAVGGMLVLFVDTSIWAHIAEYRFWSTLCAYRMQEVVEHQQRFGLTVHPAPDPAAVVVPDLRIVETVRAANRVLLIILAALIVFAVSGLLGFRRLLSGIIERSEAAHKERESDFQNRAPAEPQA